MAKLLTEDISVLRVDSMSQENKALRKSLQKDYISARIVRDSLEAIKQVITQGKSTKVGAPDGSQDISILEKMTAYILGLAGLSATGLSTERMSLFTQQERLDQLIKKVDFYHVAVSKALENVQEDINPELFSGTDEAFDEFIKITSAIALILETEQTGLSEPQEGSTT